MERKLTNFAEKRDFQCSREESNSLFRSYSLILACFSQGLVVFSSLLITFSAGIFVYRETGSLSQFSVILVCGYAPEFLTTLVSGSLVDRFRKKSVLVFCGCLHLIVCILYLLTLIDYSSTSIVYLVVFLLSSVGGLHRLVFNSSMALFARDKSQYIRINGLSQFGLAMAQIGAPIVAGLALEFSHVWIVALAAFMASFLALFFIINTNVPSVNSNLNVGASPNNYGFVQGLHHIQRSAALLRFLFVHSFANFIRGATVVLFTPLILNFSNELVLGSLRSTAGVGVVCGSIAITILGNINRTVDGVFHSLALCGLAIIAIGATQIPIFIGVAAFCLCCTMPVLASLTHAIWQKQVPFHLQGRVFSVRDSVAGGAFALGSVSGPWVTELIFVANSSSEVVGIKAAYITMGSVTLVLALIGYFQRSLKALQA